MDRYCENCRFRAYTTFNNVWGYCNHDFIHTKEFEEDMKNCDNSYIRNHRPIDLNTLPSCQFVQSVYEGKCPHKEIENEQV